MGHNRKVLKGNLILAAALFWVWVPPQTLRATGFPIHITATATNVHLEATTIPAGRLVWYAGSSVNAITNFMQMEGAAAVQHDFVLSPTAPAAFYRAVNLKTGAIHASLAIGSSHALGIQTNGQIMCWGDNSQGQFGNLSPPYQYVEYAAACWIKYAWTNNPPGPLPQSADTDWASVAAGDAHCLALKADGNLWSWGQGANGQLGDTEFDGGWCVTPVHVCTNRSWQAVFAAGRSSFAICSDGTLWAWGDNTVSVLGVGDAHSTNANILIPTQVGSASNWVKVVASPGGMGFGAGIQSDGTLWAWGKTDLPSCVRAGYASTNYLDDTPVTTHPAQVCIPGPWVDLAVSAWGSRPGIVALRADGTLWAPAALAGMNRASAWAFFFWWLDYEYNNPLSMYNTLLSFGVTPDQALALAASMYIPPVNLAPYTQEAFDAMVEANRDANYLQPYSTRAGWVMVDTGIALHQDGTAWTVGGSNVRSPASPRDGDWQRVNSDTDWSYVCSGFGGIKADGHPWMWDGLCKGNGSVTLGDDLVKIATTNQWLSAKKDDTHVVALDVQSNLWVWGGNTSGELGLGDNEPWLTPTQLPLSGPWLSYAVGNNGFTLGVRQGGELWAWGNYNATGTNLPTPMRLSPERRWSSVFASGPQAYCVGSDGTLWAWGNNSQGTLGLGNTNLAIITSPLQVAGSNWCYVSPCDSHPEQPHALGVKTDGTLWAWGYNDGALAPAATIGQVLAVPVQLPGSNWVAAAAGYREDFGICSDGTLWAWGGGPPAVSTNDLQNPTSYVFHSTLGIPALNTLINTVYFTCHQYYDSPPAVFLATTNYVTVPAQVGTDSNWKSIASAAQYGFLVSSTAMGLREDGSLWLWGLSPLASVTNPENYLTPPTHAYPGVPYPVNRTMLPVPQQVGPNTWTSVDLPHGSASAVPHGTAVTSSGALYLWGGTRMASSCCRLLGYPSPFWAISFAGCHPSNDHEAEHIRPARRCRLGVRERVPARVSRFLSRRAMRAEL